MELCSLEDAFPNIDTGSVHKTLTGSGSGFPFVGGIDAKASKEERRAARKKAKKQKGPALAYSDSVVPDLPTISEPDPDRPAVRRMEPVQAVQDQKDTFVSPILPKLSVSWRALQSLPKKHTIIPNGSTCTTALRYC
jgi:hypothetical protein